VKSERHISATDHTAFRQMFVDRAAVGWQENLGFFPRPCVFVAANKSQQITNNQNSLRRTLLAVFNTFRIFLSPLRVFFFTSRLCSSDLTLTVCESPSEVRPCQQTGTYVDVALVLTILRLFVAAEEEV
jgi:hypothetical protein